MLINWKNNSKILLAETLSRITRTTHHSITGKKVKLKPTSDWGEKEMDGVGKGGPGLKQSLRDIEGREGIKGSSQSRVLLSGILSDNGPRVNFHNTKDHHHLTRAAPPRTNGPSLPASCTLFSKGICVIPWQIHTILLYQYAGKLEKARTVYLKLKSVSSEIHSATNSLINKQQKL